MTREIVGLVEAALALTRAVERHRHHASAPASSSAPRTRISAASGRASDRRPSYFSACTIARSAPSYAPTARARSTWRTVRRQRRREQSARQTRRGQRIAAGVAQRRRQRQDRPPAASQTGPRVGWSSRSPQAAHDGARRTASRRRSRRQTRVRRSVEAATSRAVGCAGRVRRLGSATSEYCGCRRSARGASAPGCRAGQGSMRSALPHRRSSP